MGFVIVILAAFAVTCLIVQWRVSRPGISNDLPPLVIPLGAHSSQSIPEWHLVSTAPRRASSHSPATARDEAGAYADFAPPTGIAVEPEVERAAAQSSSVAFESSDRASATHAAHAEAHSSLGATVHPSAASASGTAAFSLPKAAPDVAATPAPLRVVRDFADLAEAAPSETVRFRRPSDEPVQLLPGRLEVVAGDPRRQEIRFVRVPGRPAELILGRDPGDSAQHVSLRSNTVSRQHAHFRYADGHWVVANLSQTNPVVLNDAELSARDGTRVLADGDRLELGEVVLRFHAR